MMVTTAKIKNARPNTGSRCRCGRKSGWLRPRSAWALLLVGLGLVAFPAGSAHAGAPQANDDTVGTLEDIPTTIDVLANDSDPDGDPLTIVSVVSPTKEGGTASINDNGTPGDPTDDFIDYTPPAGFTGKDEFDYTISDGSQTNTAKVTVNVGYFDFSLTKTVTFGVDDTVQTIVDTPLAIDVLANDLAENPSVGDNIGFTITLTNDDDTGGDRPAVVVTDLLPAGLTFVSATTSEGSYNSSTGEWTLNEGPEQNKTETLRIIARADVSSPITNIAEVTNSESADPDSTPDNGDPSEDDQDSATVEANGTATLSIIAVDGGTALGGTASINDNGTPGDPTDDFIDYTPPAGIAGRDTFTYTIDDGLGNTDTLTVTVDIPFVDFNLTKTVTFAVGDDSATTPIDTPTAIDVLVNDLNSANPNVGENVAFRVTLLNEDDHKGDRNLIVTDLLPAGLTFVSATVSAGSYNSSTGEWSLQGPKKNRTETLDIIATADVSTPVTNIAEITSANTFDPDSTPNNGDPTEDDQDDDMVEADGSAIITIISVDDPTVQGGTTSINDNGTGGDPSDDFIDYTPPAGFIGIDTFTYTIEDDFGVSDTATVTVTVTFTPTLTKIAFLPDGTPIPTSSTIPGFIEVKYLLYINNRDNNINDVTVRDVLDAAFQYQAGTIQVNNSVAECALTVCTAAEELAIFTAVNGAGFRSDAVDGDVASYTGASLSVDAGNGNVGNNRLDINGNRVWAILFSVKMP